MADGLHGRAIGSVRGVIEFDWDPDRAIENERRRVVSFDEAETLVNHALSRTVPDLEHSSLEERFRTIGWSGAGCPSPAPPVQAG